MVGRTCDFGQMYKNKHEQRKQRKERKNQVSVKILAQFANANEPPVGDCDFIATSSRVSRALEESRTLQHNQNPK